MRLAVVVDDTNAVYPIRVDPTFSDANWVSMPGANDGVLSAVVDDGGHLLVFNRMDGAKLSSIDISVSKAWTAACARRATHEYAEIASPGKPAYGIHVSNSGRFMIVGGGLPICLDGHVVGGIGCSSGTVHQDREVAMAGVQALLARRSSTRAPSPPRKRR